MHHFLAEDVFSLQEDTLWQTNTNMENHKFCLVYQRINWRADGWHDDRSWWPGSICLYVGLSVDQSEQFDIMGQLEAPRGRRGWCYWPLKTTGAAAAMSVVQAHPELAPRDVVLKPCLLRLVQSGHLYCADAEQWRRYSALRMPGHVQ